MFHLLRLSRVTKRRLNRWSDGFLAVKHLNKTKGSLMAAFLRSVFGIKSYSAA